MVLVQLLLWILSCRFTLFCMQLFADISGTSSLALSDSMSTAAVSTFLNTALWFAVLTCDKLVAEFGEPALRKGWVVQCSRLHQWESWCTLIPEQPGHRDTAMEQD